MNKLKRGQFRTPQKIELSDPVRFSEKGSVLKGNSVREAEGSEILLIVRNTQNTEECQKYLGGWIWFNVGKLKLSEFNKINEKGELEEVTNMTEFYKLTFEQRFHVTKDAMDATKMGQPLVVRFFRSADWLGVCTVARPDDVAIVAFINLENSSSSGSRVL